MKVISILLRLYLTDIESEQRSLPSVETTEFVWK